MTLTPAQSAYRYMLAEAALVQRHLRLCDLSNADAERMMAKATQEARALYLQGDPATQIKVAVTRRGDVLVDVTPLT